MQRRLRGWLSVALCGVAVAAFYAVLHLLGITCPIKHLTGISCPGCGMTRACLAALRLEFAAAFVYHPLWIALLPTAAAVAWLYVKQRRRALTWLLCAFGVALVLVWLVRLLSGESSVVVFAPEQGQLLRGWTRLFSRLLP